MKLIDSAAERFGAFLLAKVPGNAILEANRRSGFAGGPTTEVGFRPLPESQLDRVYRQMWVDPNFRQTIIEIRKMDKTDGRVKKIHGRMGRSAVKGGLTLRKTTNKRISQAWDRFERRLQLNRREKLESHARGLVMEGNLPIQWALDESNRVVSGVRMPAETIKAVTGRNGRFIDPMKAYEQWDLQFGKVIATFALWQLSLCRLDPQNFDDMGSLGRPYLDATRGVWKQLTMTEEDLVVRRRVRAPLRLAHVLEGANDADILAYQKNHEQKQDQITTDFYLNKKGGIQPVQGDAKLSEIADVSYLLDTFFAGAPAPKGLFGYSEGLSRDILEDLKRDYYEEIDALQDTLAYVYQQGFEFDLLLQGINPDTDDILIQFAERKTETTSQATDRALKQMALQASHRTVWETAGLDPNEELKRREDEAKSTDPYPNPDEIRPGKTSITPSNARKGDSATTVSTRS